MHKTYKQPTPINPDTVDDDDDDDDDGGDDDDDGHLYCAGNPCYSSIC